MSPVSPRHPHLSRSLLLLLALLLLGSLAPPSAAAAEKVVGAGTATSCTEAALRAALVGGGTITFSCGGPATIPVTVLFEIAADTTLDGGGLITLDGGGATRLFYVNKWERRNGTVFELRGITLANGLASGSLDPQYGGCIYARRSVTRLVSVTLRGCRAPEGGGGLYLYGGAAMIAGGSVAESGAKHGGGIHAILGGSLTVTGATFSANRARGDGGAIYVGDSPLEVRDSTFTGNVAEGLTGEPFAGLGGAIYTNLAGAVAIVAGSTFTANQASESGGAIFADYDTATTITRSTFRDNTSLPAIPSASGNGGAIGTARSATLIAESELHGNRAIGGGAIFNGEQSPMTISRSIIAGNIGEGGGGGIFNGNGGGALAIVETLVADNVAGTPASDDKQGGGLVSYRGGTVTVERSTFSGNRAIGTNAAGGGIFVDGTQLTVTASTLTGNSAVRGGGLLHNSGTSTVVASTIAGNSASAFGANIGISTGAPTLRGTIVAGGSGSAPCSKAVTDGGYNLQFPGTSCGATIPAADPLLSTLADNGGRTPTRALGAGSPAIDAGDPATCPPLDQRGFLRQGTCDIGAVEHGSAGPPASTYRVALPLVRR